MTENIVLDVIIGLMFVYLLLSLMCSALQETLARIFSLRSTSLQEGIENLLDDPNIKDAAGNIRDLKKEVYDHPLVATLAKKGAYPSYIPARNFVVALMDVLKDPASANGPLAEAKNTISDLADGPLKSALTGYIDDTQATVLQSRKSLETWFDNSMDRVSGWYKRKSQLLMLGIAFLLAFFMNVDSIELTKTLWNDPALRAQLVAEAATASQDPALRAQVAEIRAQLAEIRAQEAAAEPHVGKTPSEEPKKTAEETVVAESDDDEISLDVKPKSFAELSDHLTKIPVGWAAWDKEARADFKFFSFKTLFMFLGWLITAIFVSLGAPFWFDGLSRVLKMRSAGSRPAPTDSTAT